MVLPKSAAVWASDRKAASKGRRRHVNSSLQHAVKKSRECLAVTLPGFGGIPNPLDTKEKRHHGADPVNRGAHTVLSKHRFEPRL